MKLADAIRNVIRPPAKNQWEFSAPLDVLCGELGITTPYDYPDELDARVKSYPIFNWRCTDEHVGYDAIWLDDEPIGYTYRGGRKSSYEVRWLSAEAADKLREVIHSYSKIEEYNLIDPELEIEESYPVEFVGQSLTDEGFYKGRRVTALVWYDGLCGRTTPPEYRREGRSYTEAVNYHGSLSNCVRIQDGDAERVIPVSEFHISLNVKKGVDD